MRDIKAEGSKENHLLINLQQPDCIAAAQARRAHGGAWTSSFRVHHDPLGGNAVCQLRPSEQTTYITHMHLAQSKSVWQCLCSGTQSCFCAAPNSEKQFCSQRYGL